MIKSQETTVFSGRQKLTSSRKLRPEKWKVIWKFVLVGGAVCAIPT